MIGDVAVEPQATEPAIGKIEVDLVAYGAHSEFGVRAVVSERVGRQRLPHTRHLITCLHPKLSLELYKIAERGIWSVKFV
jgi:hypothetical protein